MEQNLSFKAAAALVSMLVLTACGSSQDVFVAEPAPEIPAIQKIAFVGNSLTLRPAKESLGWPRSHGMAASTQANDYAHLTLHGLGLHANEAYIRLFYPFETNDTAASELRTSMAPVWQANVPVAVLQLGDNVRVNPAQLYSFWNNYGALAKDAADGSGRLFCISTWWQSRIKDYIIKSACERNGGTYVHIGDIFHDVANVDRKRQDYSNVDVDRHPKDWGMQQIALRLTAAIKAAPAHSN